MLRKRLPPVPLHHGIPHSPRRALGDTALPAMTVPAMQMSLQMLSILSHGKLPISKVCKCLRYGGKSSFRTDLPEHRHGLGWLPRGCWRPQVAGMTRFATGAPPLSGPVCSWSQHCGPEEASHIIASAAVRSRQSGSTERKQGDPPGSQHSSSPFSSALVDWQARREVEI